MNTKPLNIPTGRFPDDLTLVQSAVQGEPEAQRLVAHRLYDRIRVTVCYLTANHPDQEDFVQQAIMEVLRSLDSFRGDSSLETWGNTITVRKTMRLLKDLRTKQKVITPSNQSADRRAAGMDIEDLFFVREHLIRLLGTISVKYRTVVVLSAVHGYSPDEIAQILGAPRSTVRQWYRRGRKKLASKLARDPIFARWAGLVKK